MTLSPLSVTHVIRAKPPGELGGAERHVMDLASVQIEQGHRVRVVCLGPAQVQLDPRAADVGLMVVDSMSMRHWSRSLHAMLASQRPDVLHSHGYRADLVSAAVGRCTPGRPDRVHAMTVHGFIRTSVGLRLLTRANELALRTADVVIAVSSEEAARLTRQLGRPVKFVPNGVSTVDLCARVEAARRLGVDPGQPVVAFIGRLSPEKRPDRFVALAEAMADSHPTVNFVVMGSGDLEVALRRRADEGPGRIRFNGLVPDAGSLLSAVDVLVCPSDTEGTPRVVIEAMMAGVPVVATRVGGLPDLIQHGRTGLLVEPGVLAETVGRVLDDPALAAAIGRQARGRAAGRFSMRVMADQVERTYREFMACRPNVRLAS